MDGTNRITEEMQDLKKMWKEIECNKNKYIGRSGGRQLGKTIKQKRV